MRWCPAPNCEFALQCAVAPRSLDTIIPTVQCACGNVFCFGCQVLDDGDHRPCCCPIVRRWVKKCKDDSETSNWISANTKECNKCHSTIEKNGGCNVRALVSLSLSPSSRRRRRAPALTFPLTLVLLRPQHMTCKKCKWEFCWVCMGPWSEHGTQWYNCSRYEEKGDINNKDAQSKSRAQLERYLHVRPLSLSLLSFARAPCALELMSADRRTQYYNRFANHEQSIRLEADLYARTEKKMDELQEHSTLSWIEVQFLAKAVETLGKVRTVLKWTYAMAFYLERNNHTIMFEDNQKCVPSLSLSLALSLSLSLECTS